MHTSVRTTILDNSISGDKIFGGDINYVDQLVADDLQIPHGGGTGTGSINGAAFVIGLITPINGVFAQSLGAIGDNTSIAVYESTFVEPRAYLATSLGRGYMELWSTTEQIVRLSSFEHNYINYKFMVGKKIQTQPSYIMEVEGGLYVDYLAFEYSGGSVDLSVFYGDYNANVVPIYTGLNSKFYDGSITSYAVDSLANFGTLVVGTADWNILAAISGSTGPSLLAAEFSGTPGGARFHTGVAWGEYLTTYRKDSSTDKAAIQFGSLSSENYPIKWERVGDVICVFLSGWEEDTFPSPTSGTIKITLTDVAFDDFWDQVTNAQFTVGPYVATIISAAESWHHTMFMINPPATKTIEIRRFDATAAYSSSGSNWSLDTGDKIKFPTTKLVFPADA